MTGTSEEDVLLAFAAEERHDRVTLTRYLERHPHLQDELLDLLHELRVLDDLGPGEDEVLGNGVAEKARRKLLDCAPGLARAPDGEAFALALQLQGLPALSGITRLPLELLLAFRDRCLVPGSVPCQILRRLVTATSVTIEDVLAYLHRDPVVPAAAAHSSKGKPKAQPQVPFADFLDDLELTPEQRSDLVAAPD